jgi:hypothetical protein
VLRIELNLAEHAVPLAAAPPGRLLFASRARREQQSDLLAAKSARVLLEPGDDG